ncbi:MAG: hypothetical protein IT299_12365 [Dehalococcoidia bacterium]|nr:hypothetical protein [Dehalococcoidia bacterium]
MRDILGWVSATEETVVLATGLANAGYFLGRLRDSAPRQALLLLAALYGGSALLALAQLAGGLEETPGGVALRVPLVVGHLATFLVLLMGRGR